MHAAATGRVSKGGPEGPEGPEGSLPNMLGRRPDGAALGGHGPARPAHACTCIRRLLPHRDHGDDPCEAHCPAKVTSARALAFPVPNRFQPAFSLNHPVNKYAQNKVKSPAPIAVVNELLRLSNIPIAISVEKRQKIVATRSGTPPYSVAELSDGERNAFLIAADVLTAEPGTLLLIDEPERHLHRAITSPLLSLLFEHRNDCAFIISTHDVTLPADNLKSTTLLVRSCQYDASQPKSWKCDFLPPETRIDDELKRDIIGARQKIVFVEGAATSLDAPLYSLLFPQVSVIPKSSYRDVESAVRSLRSVEETHWVQVWGIVDNDRRSAADVERLRADGVHALEYFAVESIYFHPDMIMRVASRQAHVTGDDRDKLCKEAVAGAIEEALKSREHLVSKAVEKTVRREILTRLPSREAIQNEPEFKLRIDVAELRAAEARDFDAMVASGRLDGLLQRYPLRESGALARAARELGLSKAKYEAAVRKLLQEELDALEWCRGLFGELLSEIDGN